MFSIWKMNGFCTVFLSVSSEPYLKRLKIKKSTRSTTKGGGGREGGQSNNIFFANLPSTQWHWNIIKRICRGKADTPQTDLGWCLLPVTIVEFSRLFKIQWPLSPSSRDTSWTEGQARMTEIPRGLKMFLSLTNVLLCAAQIIIPLFSAGKLLDWNLLHLPSFPASQKKI